MLLDDSRDWFFSLSEICQVITDVQMQFIAEAYTKEDERLLRPLYRYDIFDYGDVVVSSDGFKLLYPKACRLTPVVGITDNKMTTQLSRYVTPKDFLYYSDPVFQHDAPYPRDAVYTIMNDQGIAHLSYTEFFYHIYFNGLSGTKAHLWYIIMPAAFTYETPTVTQPGGSESPLTIPKEYHLDVCLMTAELLNNRDVGEDDRGDHAIVQIGQRYKFKDLSSGGPGD